MSAPQLSKKDFEFYKTKAYFIARQIGHGCSLDELIGWGLVSLAKSLKSYIPDGKMSIHSYIVQHMRWDMLDALRITRLESRQDVKNGISYKEVSIVDDDELPSCEPAVDLNKLDLIKAVGKLSPKRQQFIRAYLECGDFEEAALKVKISRECGYQHHYLAICSLREFLTSP
jgi:RNA polymerase sigma factor (sigma-70 family)